MANKNIAILDYDGYICKSYYATVSRVGTPDIDEAMKLLMELDAAAINKATEYFEGEEFKIIRAISGHTFKKDIYPTYKLHRKKDEDLGYFREYVKSEMQDILLMVPFLEADDVIVSVAMTAGFNTIVFSDDKDLRYYCNIHCKINLNEQIEVKDYFKERLEQYLIGDSEDNVTGIPKVGEATARKILSKSGYSLENIIKAYKEKGQTIDDCAKNMILIMPIRIPINSDLSVDIEAAYNAMLTDIEVMSDQIKEIYANE